MIWAFDDACVTGWQPLEGTYGLPDPNDEHLVAAAVVGSAGVIVSDNVKDLPEQLLPEGIEVVRAAQFAADAVSVAPGIARRALERISTRYAEPRRAVDDLLELLRKRHRMDQAVELLHAGSAGAPARRA